MTRPIEFLTDHIPEPGEIYEIAPGIQWVRMPLPFQLNHINLWMIEEENGWALIDSGINDDRTREIWRDIFSEILVDKPISRLICTHAHPDHIGLAGWLHDEWGAELWATKEEWLFGRMISIGGTKVPKPYNDFFHKLGCDAQMIEDYTLHILTADELYCEVPHRFRRLQDRMKLEIGGKTWEVIVCLGHAFEHASLYCAELDVMIAGDQVLPKITPTILLHAHEPEGNPLNDFLSSNEKLRKLPEDTVVLPSHNKPFRGLHTRLDEYISHHQERLGVVLEACQNEATGIEITQTLFPRELDKHGKFFASCETMAHVRYLEADGQLKRSLRADGVELYQIS